MPFFSRNSEPIREPTPPPVVEEEKARRHGLLGSIRHRSPSPTPSSATNSTQMTSSTYHTPPASAHSSGHRRSLLHRSFRNGNGSGNVDMDPSIVQARERVLSAEAAERDADRALEAARQSVRDAREHVQKLELEAKEEARRAKIKQFHAKEVSKRGKQLGRHDL